MNLRELVTGALKTSAQRGDDALAFAQAQVMAALVAAEVARNVRWGVELDGVRKREFLDFCESCWDRAVNALETVH